MEDDVGGEKPSHGAEWEADVGEETPSRGTEWEVVQLTESTFAAAPGPKEIQVNDSDKEDMPLQDEAETSRALFMSGHFVFPPNEHENLPVEPIGAEIQCAHGDEDVVTKLDVEEGVRSNEKGEENWKNIEGLNIADEFPGIQIFDEKGNRLSVHGKEFTEGTALDALSLVDDEQNLFDATSYSSFHGETDLGGSTAYDENTVISEPIEPTESGLNFPVVPSHSPKPVKDDYNGSDLPCGAWWKRRAASLYAYARETNAFWSVFIAAAVMGLVILGQQWQKERWQVLQMRWQFNINDEASTIYLVAGLRDRLWCDASGGAPYYLRMGKMLGPLTRFKDVIVGGNRRGSFIRSRTSAEH
ncbi:hypothetical protein RJ641_016016 [Dillenia turbinata]|uniref:Uncharacterized protein n=1 Tax=Dillenia turbinata TaxID=194707 RepID=A0AAN8V356_9MAGN